MRGISVRLGMLAVALLAAACGSSGSSGSSGGTGGHTPVTITLWHLFSGEEAKPFKDAMAGFYKKYPWIHVKMAVQPNTTNDTFDPNLINAIKGGNAPDVALPFGPDYVAQYCTSGLWQDLTPYMQRDHISIDDFAKAAISYTNFGGKQCALPSLTDAFGLYYNKDLLQKAGISSPPKTMSELMDDAKKLTVRNPDGSIKVAGFVPLNEWEELGPSDLGRAWGAQWFDSSGNPQLATDPGWTSAFEWQKQLIDWYGYDNIEKFFATYTNAEFNANNAFETGKVAMTFDGEWRTAFIQRDNPNLNYGTAPFPVADDHPDLYGSGRVGGTVVGMPKGSEHPDEAWLLVKYLATDPGYLVTIANSAGNVPTTTQSASSPDLNLPPTFKTFIDVWNNPDSNFQPPLLPSGAGYADLVDKFESQWEAGKVSDLHAALAKLDTDIQNQIQQGQVP
ncbi:MAG TPA: ABC transporter substrate-binding protein [Gaiellales bacterium]|nr:ABC transporter substrate-binding protein [Gaiellales bacterium]